MGPFAVILPAAGRSSRFGDPKQKKIFAELDGRAVWLRAVEPFVNRDDVAPDDRRDRPRGPRAVRAPVPAERGVPEHPGHRGRGRAVRHGRPGPGGGRPARASSSPSTTPRGPAWPPSWSTPSSRRRASTARRSWPCRSPTRSSASATDRLTTETVPRERPLPGPDAAGLPPRAALSGLRQRDRLGRPGHRRHPARRGDRAPLRGRRGLAAEPQDHDRRRPPPRRGRPPGARPSRSAKAPPIRSPTSRRCGATCPSSRRRTCSGLKNGQQNLTRDLAKVRPMEWARTEPRPGVPKSRPCPPSAFIPDLLRPAAARRPVSVAIAPTGPGARGPSPARRGPDTAPRPRGRSRPSNPRPSRRGSGPTP